MPLIDSKNTQVILIGTSEIEDEKFQSIPNVIGNLSKLQDLLFTVVGIDKSNIHPFFDKDNSSEITKKVIEIIPKATDTVIVYYAGHCVRYKQELYFTTTGTQSRDPKNTGAILAGDLLQTVIEKSKAKNIIFILDCCLSGLASKYIDDKEKNVFLITATTSNETAKDKSPENENLTAFTNELLSILEKGIDSAGKNLTIWDIFNSLEQKLESKNLPKPRMVPYGSPEKLEICKNRAYKQRDSSKISGFETSKNIDVEQGFKLSNSFSDELISTEIVFQHRYKDNITLNDVFVYPDLKIQKEKYDDIEISSDSEKLSNFKKINAKTLIFGEEQTGKTAFLKILFQKYFDQGIYPLLINGECINKTDLKKVLNPIIKLQYDGTDYEDFVHCSIKKILLIDDFHLSKLNERYQKKFLSDDVIGSIFDRIIIVSDPILKYNESKLINFSDYVKYEILPFGHVRRSDLINKWNSLGREETIETEELHSLNDSLKRHIDSIIRKNIVPSKPVYILMILQSLETAQPGSYELTSYGHCYQYLIQQSLQKAIKNDLIDTCLNYLTEISYFVFKQGGMSIDDEQLETFKKEYSNKFLIKSHELIIEILFQRGILKSNNDKIKFGYKYIFYFYVAKYLTEHLDKEDCKKTVEILCEKLHVEKNANILIFLLHHSKNQSIIDEILVHTSCVFDDIEEAKLDLNDTKHLADMLNLIPQLLLDAKKDVEKERKKKLEKQDIIEKNTSEEEEEIVETEIEIEKDTNKKILSKINYSIKSVEIIGQILRNRHGSLEKKQLYELTESAYGVILRFLKFFINTSSESKSQLLELIENLIRETNSCSDQEAIKITKQFYLFLNYGIFSSVIQKVSDSLGFGELMPIFDELTQNHKDSPAIKLINISIKLEFTRNIPKKEISNLFKELKNNMIARRMLQEIVLRYLYSHYTSYHDKHWISSTLEIPIKSQMRIEQKKEYKVTPK